MTPDENGLPNRNSTDGAEKLRALAHDLRHCLFALRTGIQLLPQVRDDVRQFNELQELLDKDAQNASDVLKELLDLAAQESKFPQ